MAYLILINFCFCIILHEALSYNFGCQWTNCLPISKSDNISTAIICGTSSQYIQIRQGCYINNTTTGRKFYCCSTLRVGKDLRQRNCTTAMEKPNAVSFWWPNDEGIWTEVSLYCPNAPPIDHFLKDELVEFFLYTSNNNDTKDYDLLYVDDLRSLEESRFIQNAPVKMISHGYLGNVETEVVPNLREYYLRLDPNVNIIAVNWSILANVPCYNISAQATRFVGKRSALLLQFLLGQTAILLEDVHVLGFSLGAHVSGFNGKRFFEYTGRNIPRISGLDPAGPLFKDRDPSERIDRSDAEFVDIIHTSISDYDYIPGYGESLELGMAKAIGHVDFYPNKGGKQPRCQGRVFPYSNSYCSHRRSFVYYAESISPPSNTVFRGIRCEDVNEAMTANCTGPQTTLMGACTDLNSFENVIYYLRTRGRSPYALDDRNSDDYKYCPIP